MKKKSDMMVKEEDMSKLLKEEHEVLVPSHYEDLVGDGRVTAW